MAQDPANDTVLVKGIPFKMHWQVMNAGTFGWDENSADYRYASGDKLSKVNAYDFSQSVPTGGVIDFVVEMQAPNDPGSYSTTWQIAVGKERFCPMKVTIVVN
jgi:hypothetical protein